MRAFAKRLTVTNTGVTSLSRGARIREGINDRSPRPANRRRTRCFEVIKSLPKFPLSFLAEPVSNNDSNSAAGEQRARASREESKTVLRILRPPWQDKETASNVTAMVKNKRTRADHGIFHGTAGDGSARELRCTMHRYPRLLFRSLHFEYKLAARPALDSSSEVLRASVVPPRRIALTHNLATLQYRESSLWIGRRRVKFTERSHLCSQSRRTSRSKRGDFLAGKDRLSRSPHFGSRVRVDGRSR